MNCSWCVVCVQGVGCVVGGQQREMLGALRALEWQRTTWEDAETRLRAGDTTLRKLSIADTTLEAQAIRNVLDMLSLPGSVEALWLQVWRRLIICYPLQLTSVENTQLSELHFHPLAIAAQRLRQFMLQVRGAHKRRTVKLRGAMGGKGAR